MYLQTKQTKKQFATLALTLASSSTWSGAEYVRTAERLLLDFRNWFLISISLCIQCVQQGVEREVCRSAGCCKLQVASESGSGSSRTRLKSLK